MKNESEKPKMSKKRRITTIVASILAFAIVCVVVVVPVLYRFGYIESIHKLNTPKDGQIRVACIGDSVTYGMGVQGWPEKAYPGVLGGLLGNEYCVNNYGYSGRCALSDADRPYKDEKLYRQSLEFSPDIVVIMLGSNDTKSHNWKGVDRYMKDYSELIETYIQLESAPRVYLVTPPPAFPKNGEIKYGINTNIIAHELRGTTRSIAAAKGLDVIDMYAVFENRSDLYVEGVHPNAEGASLFARTVYEALIKGTL